MQNTDIESEHPTIEAVGLASTEACQCFWLPQRRTARKLSVSRMRHHHFRVRNIRRHFLHAVSNELVKTHDRLVIEDLHVAGMMRNRRLARAIGDAGWTELSRQILYKAKWRGGEIVIADRWYPSSQICSRCDARNSGLTLADRIYTCGCGHSLDRDLNAAANLARWAENQLSGSPDLQAGGRANNACRRIDTHGRPTRVGDVGSDDAGTDVQSAPPAA